MSVTEKDIRLVMESFIEKFNIQRESYAYSECPCKDYEIQHHEDGSASCVGACRGNKSEIDYLRSIKSKMENDLEILKKQYEEDKLRQITSCGKCTSEWYSCAVKDGCDCCEAQND